MRLARTVQLCPNMQTTKPSTLGTKKPNFWMVARRAVETEILTKMISERKFKSARSAKIAFTKAENAAKVADSAVAKRIEEARRTGYGFDDHAEIRKLELDAEQLWDAARAIYNAANAQEFYIYSARFGYNATRDLIRDNID